MTDAEGAAMAVLEREPVLGGEAEARRIRSAAARGSILRYDDLEALSVRLEDEARGARRSIWSALPGGQYDVTTLRSSWEDDVALISSGRAGPVVYQADSVRRPEVMRYLTEFAAAGAQVRVAVRVPHRMILFDRRTVAVAVEPDTLAPPYLVSTEPAVVQSFYLQFASLWRSAQRVGTGPDDLLAESTVREILEVMAAGVTDEVAAKQLGVSTRTVRRRMAAVMTVLGARSRFEAGVKAARSGWL
ncbi:helix-turn-helix transcriptional regulator [Cellulomonas endophytica]|uniref:helix-turn-helix transcriptional regulator n=1 Tax=Cellulomonas endophytica TaxID=2494735 RepID=UPI0010109E15|nr:helix-turn-helix transcriptional regulator [Cellulomonas endophytica]